MQGKMSEFIGNEHLQKHFSSLIKRDRLHHCLLFEGPSGVGKKEMAKWLAKRIFCDNGIEMPICGRCWHCQAVDTDDHPDVIHMGLDPTKRRLQISVDQARDLIQRVAVHPRMKNQRVVIIDQARYLKEETANALLKTFEEPPTNTIFILVATSAKSMLPTVRSRSQRVLFRPVSREILKEWLQKRGEYASEHLIRMSQGCPGQVFKLMEGEYEERIRARDLIIRLSKVGIEQMYLENESFFKSFSSTADGSQQKVISLNRLLDAIEILLRDVFVWQSTADVDKLIHFDCLDTIDLWASKIDDRCIQGLQKLIIKAREDQAININARLQMEMLYTQLRFALDRGYIA
jgi:DNA polymerase III subunit delta'